MRIFNPEGNLGGALSEKLEAFSALRSQTFYPKTDGPLEERLQFRAQARQRQVSPNGQAVAEACAPFLNQKIDGVEFLPNQGTFHLLYRLRLDGGGALICRTTLVGDPFPAFEFLADAWVMEILPGLGLPAVPVYGVNLSRQHHPFDFEIMAEAPGIPLRTLEDKETQYLAPDLLAALGRAVALIHQVETQGFGLLDIRALLSEPSRGQGILSSWEAYINLNLEHHIRMCADIQAINPGEAARIEEAFSQGDHLLEKVPSCLLHGDLGHHNIFSRGGRITAIIDWEDALCGDPVFDAAYWGTFVRDHMREPFLAGYRDVRALPADFEPRYWLYYLRVALSKTVHRHKFNYQDRPGRPPAHLRILKGLERFEALHG